VWLIDEKFGDVFVDNNLCVVTTADLHFKVVPFNSSEQCERAVTATLRAMGAATDTTIVGDQLTVESSIP